jgi:uncharacterized membrane protein
MERVPRWAVVWTFALSLLGLAIATYLTIAHFDSSVELVCRRGGPINCEEVTQSAQSHFLGIPVAVLGLGQYVVMSVLNSPWVWRRKERWIHLARFALAAVGFCFVLWLIYAEVVLIQAICLWCTAVHVITFAILIILTRVEPVQLGWAEGRELDSAEAN